MTSHHSMKKSNALNLASRMRGRGLNASVSKIKKGYSISVTKK